MSSETDSELLVAFSFRVELWLPGAESPLCDAAFASCDGLEMRFEVRSVRDAGGHHLFSAPAAPGRVTLRRGMTASFDLWHWCTRVARDRGPRVDCRIIVLEPDGATERARFLMRGCLPVRLRGPDLNAMGGGVAIEELELAGESLALESHRQDPGTAPAKAAFEAKEPETIERAELRELDQEFKREINAKKWVRAQVNPESIETTFSNVGTESGGSGNASLSLDLWLDSTADSEESRGPSKDIQQLTDAVTYFMTPQPVRGGGDPRPPAVRLAWGSFSFDGHMQVLRQSLELFGPDGRAGRARLSISVSRPWIVKPPRG